MMTQSIRSIWRRHFTHSFLHWLQRWIHIISLAGLVVTFCITVFLHEIVSSSSSFSERGFILPHTKDANINHVAEIKSNVSHTRIGGDTDNVASKECPPYGCPIFPVVIPTTESEQQHFKNKNNNSYSNYNYTALTQRGLDHVVNQDRGLVVLRNPHNPNDESDIYHHDSRFYFAMGIFDGHGDEGHKVSQHLQSNFLQKLDSKLNLQEKEDMQVVLTETFVEIDSELDPSIGNDGGSTAAVVLHRRRSEQEGFSNAEDVLYFASVGDSLCILIDKGKGDILFRTKYDKPHMEEERARILAMGGKIHTPPKNPKQARSVAFSNTNQEMISLAMSRAIGDWEHLGVVATPHINAVKLPKPKEGRGEEGFVVACGSDGMFDARQPEFIARQLAEFGANRTAHLIEVATPKNPNLYRDDITLMALEIDGRGRI